MIYGIGTDILQINRIEAALERHGERFAAKILGPQELAKFRARREKVEARGIRFLATRFAAKEACSKALGTGLSFGVYWRDMGVVNLPSGKPTMKLTNGALRALERLVPPGHEPHIHITITDDAGLAQAFVVIEALPVDPSRASV